MVAPTERAPGPRPALQRRPDSSLLAAAALTTVQHNATDTYSGGNNFSSSMFPRNPNRVLICSDVVLGDTLVT